MLERTAGCVENGSLRRLLPASKKTLKSCRQLHSGFWSHAASDSGLSPLWVALVRAAQSMEHQDCVLQRSDSASHGGLLLDFLYPAGTINLLQHFSKLSLDRPDGRTWGFGIGKFGYRPYTTSAQAASTGQEAGLRTASDYETRLEDDSTNSLRQTLGLKSDTEFEKVLRKYRALDDNAQAQLRLQVIRYLSTSDRIVDAECTVELFGLLEDQERIPMAYCSTIRSYLKLRNLADAMRLNETACKLFRHPTGSDQLLAYLIDNSIWTRALAFWQENQQTARGYNIYAVVDALPNLGQRALQLADYVKNKPVAATPNSTNADALLSFASAILRRALVNYAAFEPLRFTTLLETLQEWNQDTPILYEELVKILLYLKQSKVAVKCYRKARSRSKAQLTTSTLHDLLEVFCNHHSSLGIQQVLDDFFEFHGHPTRSAFKMCMVEFARQGDVQMVHSLFERYTQSNSEAGRDRLFADDFVPLLHVHAKRGEVSEVVKLFNEMDEEYGLQPTLACWNVLISAYGKVNDIDRAYGCFETVLNSENLKPDDYTFGTMMGIYVARGELLPVLKLYKLAEELGILKTPAMINCLVIGYLQHDQIKQAENLCEESLKMPLRGSRTRMWNYLLIAYAKSRDLANMNRVLGRMSDAGIKYDQYTYSALMQALAMVKQPDRAYAIMKDVMPKAGIQRTSFHYAVVMGGYIANGETHKVFRLQKEMLRQGIKPTARSSLLALKATFAEDQRILERGTDEERFQRAVEMFEDVAGSVGPQDISDTSKKHAVGSHLDTAALTMFYGFKMFVFGQHRRFDKVNELYEEFQNTIPESRRDTSSIQILSALMSAKCNENDHLGVQECWDLAFSQAKKQGMPVKFQKNEKVLVNGNNATKADDLRNQGRTAAFEYAEPECDGSTILPSHQLDLTRALTVYMRTLDVQGRIDDLQNTINSLLDTGFALDNHNWNHYITVLAKNYKYKQAFEQCESKLMDGWTGWANLRWQQPGRNRLPIEVRNLKKQPRYLRPKVRTFHAIARAYLDLQALSAESTESQKLLQDLERSCPRVLYAIRTMQRQDDSWERLALQA